MVITTCTSEATHRVERAILSPMRYEARATGPGPAPAAPVLDDETKDAL